MAAAGLQTGGWLPSRGRVQHHVLAEDSRSFWIKLTVSVSGIQYNYSGSIPRSVERRKEVGVVFRKMGLYNDYCSGIIRGGHFETDANLTETGQRFEKLTVNCN